MEASGYELGFLDLRATTLATARSRNDASAMSALMELDRRGMAADWELISALGSSFATHMRRMDETYYALADAAKVEKIPSSALEAIIVAAGKAGSIDR